MESWEEFAKAAERLYSHSPWKVSIDKCCTSVKVIRFRVSSLGEILREVQAL